MRPNHAHHPDAGLPGRTGVPSFSLNRWFWLGMTACAVCCIPRAVIALTDWMDAEIGKMASARWD